MMQAMSLGQQLFSSGASAVNDSCSKSSGIFNIMQTGLSGYIAACEASKLTCANSCGGAVKALEQLDKKVTDLKNKIMADRCAREEKAKDLAKVQLENCNIAMKTSPPTRSECKPETKDMSDRESEFKVCTANKFNFNEIWAHTIPDPSKKELDSDNECKSVASKKYACAVNYTTMVLGGAQTIKGLMDAFKKSSGCDQASSTGGAPPVATNPSDVDCSKAENASNEKCICLANPRMAGCNNSLSAMSDNNSRIPTSTSGAAAATNGTQSGLTSGDLGSGSPSALAAGDGKSADSSGSGPRGGGSGGLGFGGGSGGGGSVGDQAKAAGKSGLDTNVLSGEGGGSGGSFGGGSAALEQALEKEKADLSDPEKVAAAAWAQQVSPESGKSNFDKIKDRYNANRRTLMSK